MVRQREGTVDSKGENHWHGLCNTSVEVQTTRGAPMKRRIFVKALAIAASVAAIGVSGSAAAQQKTIKVGILHSLSGTMAISETVL
jgi:hypothetical protein